MSPKYKLFVSYSHIDERLAATLQTGLRRIGTPWFRSSRIRVFRDETGLEVGSHLRASLEKHLEQSEYFLLLASPTAAESRWVRAEIEWWIRHRPEKKILLVITDGVIKWDPDANDFNWDVTTCLPDMLRQHFVDEPLFVDMRWAKGSGRPTLKDERFRNAVLSLAAPLHGLSREELDIEDRRAQRRFAWIASLASLALLVLTIVAFYGWDAARENSSAAAQIQRESESRRLTAKALEQFRSGADLDRAIILAVYAWRLRHTSEAAATLKAIQRASSNLAKILGQHTQEIAGVAFHPKGDKLATLSGDGSVRFWRVGSWEPADSLLVGPRGTPWSAQFDAMARHLLVQSFDQSLHGYHLVIWDLQSNQQTSIPTNPGPFGDDAITGVTLNLDGTEIAIAWQWHVMVWDVKQGRERVRSPEFGRNVEAMHFIDRDHLLLVAATVVHGVARAGDALPQVQLWDLRNGSITSGPQVEMTPDYAEMHHPLFAPDGSAIVWREGYVPMLRQRQGLVLSRGLPLTDDPSPSGYSPTAAFDARGSRLFVEYDGQIVVWDVKNHRVLRTIGPFGGGDPTPTASISPDGRWIAGLNQGKVQIWDLNREGTEAATLDQKTCDVASEACLQVLCDKISLPKDPAQLETLLGDDAGGLDSLLLGSSCRN